MALPLRPLRLIAALLLCAFVVAPFAADAQSRRSRRSRKAPPAVKVAPPQEDEAPPQQSSGESGSPPSRGPTRIDFDDRLVQGQTNKSGAVYLYDRKELKQRSMVKVRESFREEIVQTVYER